MRIECKIIDCIIHVHHDLFILFIYFFEEPNKSISTHIIEGKKIRIYCLINIRLNVSKVEVLNLRKFK